MVLWSDSTTVLSWIKSESYTFKVFVGTRIAEIQDLTDQHEWRYVDSPRNPADDLTRGRHLIELATPNRWSQGPPFLLQAESKWPAMPTFKTPEDEVEKRKSVFCGVSRMSNPLEPSEYSSWKDLVEATVQHGQRDSNQSSSPTAKDYVTAERLIFQNIQQTSYPDEYEQLKAGKPVSTTSRLLTLAPEFDESSQLIRVGGRLRRAEGLELQTIHPVVLDPHHPATKLLIQDYDSKLCHPGPERVFAEMRRNVWILRGREAV